MESNSPGHQRRDRSRSRTRSGLSSRVNFFEQVQQSTSSHSVGDDSVFDQSQVDQLEREIHERRQRTSRASVADDQRRPSVTLRRIASPSVGDGPSQPLYATEVYISSWTERVRSPDPVLPPTPPQRSKDVQPPWRLGRRSEPRTPEEEEVQRPSPPPFSADVTTPSSALSKYQEWRARRLTSVETEVQVAPWRRQQMERRVNQSQDKQPDSSGDSRWPPWVTSPSSVKRRASSNQPQWYSEFRTASLSQTAMKMDAFRPGGIQTHYDFHIAEIKGRLSSFVSVFLFFSLIWFDFGKV